MMAERPADVLVRPPSGQDDEEWLHALWREEWGGDVMVTKGRVHRVEDLSALIAWAGETRVGAATFHLDKDGCELTSLNANAEGRGVGSALLRGVEEFAARAGYNRVWLITSNDNLDALRFYQRRGYRLVAVYPGAVDEARKLKPSIPLVGSYDIPIRDDIELEKRVG